MKPILYFLRSSESKIVKNMTQYAHKEAENLSIYYDFYGLTTKDLGLYALVDNQVAGAIWTREFENKVPILSLAIVPKFRSKGIAIAMMEQFLIEAGAVYETLIVQSYDDEKNIQFYTKFGFTHMNNSSLMQKNIEKKEIVRPSDGYDPRKWMD